MTNTKGEHLKYTPQVGDRVRYWTWSTDHPGKTVEAVGPDWVVMRGDDGSALTYYELTGWIKVEPKPEPLPSATLNIYGDGGVGVVHTSCAAGSGSTIVATVFIGTDEDGNDYARIERE